MLIQFSLTVEMVFVMLAFMAVSCVALTPPPDRPIIKDTEIAWMGATSSSVICVWADGLVREWDIRSAKPRSSFSLSGYKFDKITLSVSSGPRPYLAAVEGSNIDNHCRFYDIKDVIMPKIVMVKESSGLTAGAFSKNGRELFCEGGDAVYRIDIERGTVNKLSYPDLLVIETQFEETGKYFINLCTDYVVARDWNGQVLWKRGPNDGNEILESVVCGPLSFSLLVYEDSNSGVKAFSLVDGREVWSNPTMDWRNIRAYSRNGQLLALWQEKSLSLVETSGTKRTTIPAIARDVDAIFSPDDKYLVVIPRLEISETDEKNHTYTLRRNGDPVVSVIDSNTADIIGRITVERVN